MPNVTLQVPARSYWVDTGLKIAAQQPVTFKASGTWRDWFIDCDPDGYDRPYLAPVGWLRRVSAAPWFCLCVALDRNIDTARPVGSSAQITFNRPGQIFAFANDAFFAYGNNSGAITLEVKA